MALTTPRWLAIAICACAMIAYGFLRARPLPDTRARFDEMGFRIPASVEAQIALGQENERLHLLELRDSILAARGTTPGNGLTVSVDPRIPAATARRIDEVVHTQWSELGTSHPLPVAVVVVVDTSASVHGLPRGPRRAALPIDVFLPPGTDGRQCLAIMRIRVLPSANAEAYARQVIERDLVSPETIGSLFGPCAYYAAFGPPGPEIARWLRNDGWRSARQASWRQPAPPWLGQARDSYSEYYDPSSLASRLTAFETGQRAIRQFVAFEGIACLVGQAGRCRDALLRDARADEDSAWRSRVVATSGSNYFSSFFMPLKAAPLGPNEGWILSDMAYALGTDRFEKFWQSTLPVPEAFRQASGEDLDDWVRRWARASYGEAVTGPAVNGIALYAGTIAVGLAILLSVAFEQRRRVA